VQDLCKRQPGERKGGDLEVEGDADGRAPPGGERGRGEKGGGRWAVVGWPKCGRRLSRGGVKEEKGGGVWAGE
jgi:hypothetical protein